MNRTERYVMQIGETIRYADSLELAATFLARRLYVSEIKLRGQLLKSGVAIANIHGSQGYIFDTQFITNARKEQ